MKKIISVILLLTLIGCDAEVQTTVKISELNSKNILSSAKLLIEVPACNDYKDSRLESQSLIRAKKEIKQTFNNIEYEECYTKEMKSFASFAMPILVGSDFSKIKEEDAVKANLVISKNKNNVMLIALPDLRNRINNLKQQASNLKFKITITILNDTDETIEQIDITNKFYNGMPIDNGYFSLKPNSSVDITLSDVSTQVLLRTDKNEKNPQGFTKLMSFK